jgi:WD40 repeat protein
MSRISSMSAGLAAGLIAGAAAALAASTQPMKLVLQSPPPLSVDSVAVSPDGSLVAAASGEGGVRFHDAKTGALLRVLGAGDRSVVFSPDGRTFTAAGFHMDKLVGIYDVQTGKRVRTLEGQTEWEAFATAFSPDGKLLASTAADMQILVWDVATGALKLRLASQPARVTALAFSPDGTTLATGSGDKTVRLIDVATGQVRRRLDGHRDWVCTLAYLPDGKSIASGCCDWALHRGRNTAYFDRPDPGCTSEWKLWDARSGDCKRTVTEPGRMRSLAVSPDGRSLACGVGKDVKLYNLASESPGRVVARHDFDVTSVAFTPDCAAVISGSHDHTVQRIALATGQTDWRAPGYYEQVNSVAISRDGTLLVTGSSDGRYAVRVLKAGARELAPGAVRLWDARNGRLLRRLGAPREQIMAVGVSPEGRQVAGGGTTITGGGVVSAWDAATGARAWSHADHDAEILAIAYSPDGSLVATAGADGLVRLRNPATGLPKRTLEGHERGATSLAFSAVGATLVCGDGRGAARVWDVKTGRLLQTCRVATSMAGTVTTDRLFTPVALTPDAATVITCPATMGNTYGEPVRFWDTKTGELKRSFDNPAHSARPIALSPDGTILAAGGKSIRLIDVRTGQQLREFSGHLKKTQSIVFSADGRLIFAGGSYGTTNAWEVATGRHLVTLFAFPKNQNGTIVDDWLAYHPDSYYDGSPGIERYLGWRVGDEFKTPETIGERLRRPDRLAAALSLTVKQSARPEE